MAIDPVSLAITAAVTAVNMAVSASRTIEGPRLNDTSATVADYGTPLNYFVGMRVLSCPSFFAKPILEVKKKRKGKGGKQVEYSGFGTWASHVADHQITGIGKIWFDNHLVYDATGSEEKVYPLGSDYELEANVRIYLGGEDQEPDPDMLAYIEARDGPGTCPAYRPTSYIYFDNIPLEMLGNRFPAVSVLCRTASPAPPPVFTGWYAKATVAVTKDGAPYPLAGWYVDPDQGPSIFMNTNGVWPGTANDEFPAGIPYRVFNGDGSIATVYYCNPEIMDTAVIDLRHQFPAGTGAKQGTFTWQWWNTELAGPIPPFAGESGGTPFAVGSLFPQNWYFNVGGGGEPELGEPVDAGNDTVSTLEILLNFVSERAGVDPADYDWSACADIEFGGYNWTQGTGRQILEPLLDLFDVDVRPHDFILEALPRGSGSEGAIITGEMVRTGDAPYGLKDVASTDLPRRIFLVYSDMDADQNPNVAMPPGPDPDAAGAVRELTIDMQTVALWPDLAQQLAERHLRRVRFGRMTGEFSMTRQRLAVEPGDVWTPTFDDRSWSMRNTKVTIGADGVLGGEWERDNPAIAILSGVSGAPSAGYIPEAVPDAMPSLGLVLDTALLQDSQDQSAPLAYLVAGPEEPGTWTGADFAQSETGELDSYTVAWDGIAAGFGSVIGECGNVLPDVVPWVLDNGSVLQVVLNVGELTAASLDDLLLDPMRNLAAIRSGTGWELVQFMNAALVGTLSYEVTGFIRGVRGTEWAMAGHQAGDEFVLLDTVKLRTMGAGELADTDWYVVSPTGQLPDQDTAFTVTYTGASHKPYAPVDGTVEFAETSPGAGDLLFSATRRTRIGGATLDGQDVPLGETSESWSLDILDNTVSPVAVKRTIASASLPITYTEAQQIADWGAALNASSPIVIPEANLYQVSPPLTLRGYPLNFPEHTP